MVLPARFRDMAADTRIRKILLRWRREIELEDRVNSLADKVLGAVCLALGVLCFAFACYLCYRSFVESAPAIAVAARQVSLTAACGALCVALGLWGASVVGMRFTHRTSDLIAWSVLSAIGLAGFAIIGVIPLAFIKF